MGRRCVIRMRDKRWRRVCCSIIVGESQRAVDTKQEIEKPITSPDYVAVR